jgi:uncharacterized damage-inducible protein DinB
MRRKLSMLAASVALLAASAARAEDAKLSGFRGDLMANLDDAAGKVIELAEAIPAEKYGWRPAEGVRSVAEVFTHLAGSNYFLLGFAGVKPPAGMGPEDALDKETDKAKIIAALKSSYDFTRDAIRKAADSDMDTKMKLPWAEMSKRSILLLTVTHSHEHLGQQIAYARSNGVVPPWTAREMAAAAAAKKGS